MIQAQSDLHALQFIVRYFLAATAAQEAHLSVRPSVRNTFQSLHLLATFGNIWQHLATFGNFW